MSEKVDFEKSMERLEIIVGELEEGEFALEDSLKKFEEGLLLGNQCKKVLEDAEQRIKKLVEDVGGEFKEEEYE